MRVTFASRDIYILSADGGNEISNIEIFILHINQVPDIIFVPIKQKNITKANLVPDSADYSASKPIQTSMIGARSNITNETSLHLLSNGVCNKKQVSCVFPLHGIDLLLGVSSLAPGPYLSLYFTVF